MPTGRNTHVEPAARLLKQTNFKEVFGYRNYLDLIGEISREDAYADILGVEMDLFTNAPLIASTFVTKTQTISFASR